MPFNEVWQYYYVLKLLRWFWTQKNFRTKIDLQSSIYFPYKKNNKQFKVPAEMSDKKTNIIGRSRWKLGSVKIKKTAFIFIRNEQCNLILIAIISHWKHANIFQLLRLTRGVMLSNSLTTSVNFPTSSLSIESAMSCHEEGKTFNASVQCQSLGFYSSNVLI